ncbi:MAG: hypothetical protein KGO96_10580 [Elusimicrobia bacterium]|nr:hypothetical protein [Elusimicrobiota bacterium]
MTLPTVNVTAQAPIQSPGVAPYERRIISLQFDLSHTVFENGSSTLTRTGLRVRAVVTNALFPSLPSAVLKVYGLTLSHMNALTVAGTRYLFQQNPPNTVTVSAGDATSGMTTIFKGNIYHANPDGQQPDMGFDVVAVSSTSLSMPAAKPTTFNGATPASQVLNSIAQQLGVTVQNNGVTATITNPYFAGSVLDQFKDAIEAADCYAAYDAASGALVIWPKTTAPSASGAIPLFSPANGMIGYPAFENNNVIVRSLFDPTLNLKQGGQFQVQSQFTAACGTFNVYSVDYNLASQSPEKQAPWEMIVKGYPPGEQSQQ